MVWGAGGHGRVVAELAGALGHHVIGFVDRNPNGAGSAGAPVISEQEWLGGRFADPECARAKIALGIGNNAVRLERAKGLHDDLLVVLIDPSATVRASAAIGLGSVVCAHAVVNSQATLGRAVIVNTGAVVEHDCRVEDGAHVSPGAILAGRVTVGRESWIGAGAVIIPGVTIGANSVVGAGSVVIRDVPPEVVVVGNPARVLRPSPRIPT